MSNFYTKVYEAVKRIPKGTVATYGQIAALCGNPRAARVVGWALRSVPNTPIPWQRVIASSGHLTIVNPEAPAERQKQLLESEGVAVAWDESKQLFIVDLDRYLWKP